MTNVLVTGAGGLIGRPTVDALAGAGREVHAVTRRSGPDLHDHRATDELVARVRPAILVHLAWELDRPRYLDAPSNRTWVDTSLALLDAFARHGGRHAVLAGSCAEDFASFGLYATCKRELAARAAERCAAAGIGLSWVRPFFVYGPGERPGRLVPSVVASLLAGHPTEISEGTQRRDYVFSADVGPAFAAVADREAPGRFDVGTGEAVAVVDLARALAEAVGRPELLRVGARPRREGEPDLIAADPAPLTRATGWQATTPLATGVARTVEWWRVRLTSAAGTRPGSG